MRTFLGLSFGIILSVSLAFGQRGGGQRGGGHGAGYPSIGYQPRTFGSTSGFGNILFPGTGSAPPPRASGFGTRPIMGTYPFGYGGYGGFGGRRGTIVVPFGVPMYVGGYGYDPGAPAPDPAPPQVISNTASAPVVINQYYTPEVVRPQVKEYTDLPPAAPRETPRPAAPGPEPPKASASPAEDKPNITLLAFKDGNIAAVLGYWLEGDTVQYITTRYAKKSASAESVDRALSDRLNRERNVEFRLE